MATSWPNLLLPLGKGEKLLFLVWPNSPQKLTIITRQMAWKSKHYPLLIELVTTQIKIGITHPCLTFWQTMPQSEPPNHLCLLHLTTICREPFDELNIGTCPALNDGTSSLQRDMLGETGDVITPLLQAAIS